MFDFRRITLLCLEKRLSTQKMTIFSKNLGEGMAPLAPPCLRLYYIHREPNCAVQYVMKTDFEQR